ncbi:uncharacterized protein K460DRAFT_384784 [Cucurbitaria berberidis CBS 394.84]|uniref:Uncharacterized protein n=1 Tax=Cucurbitaria berberidis CBS 394.84 TaxID=1168544 RepID=A0A9P4LC36_9PLEO|nr:uncharacterized protein K460DRAFT_384784 [Cucurbitaria berberidis CBS 394.84]KAF1848764.1 hypothetical protein K460DRAFT_384784 [Cucurbitaria berberidis CBS 394.84]
MSSALTPPPSRLQGQGLLVLWGRIDSAVTDEDALNDWWTNEHLPERLRLPGFQRARRYHSLDIKDGKKEYLAMYETAHAQDLASPEYLSALDNPTPRTKQFMPCLARMNRSACEVQFSEMIPATSCTKGVQVCQYLLMVVLGTLHHHPELHKDLISTLNKTLCLSAPVGLTTTHIAEVKDDITKIGSASKSYESVQFTQRHDSSHDQNDTKIIAFSRLTCETHPVSRMRISGP